MARITDDGYEPGDPKSEEYMEHVLDHAEDEDY